MNWLRLLRSFLPPVLIGLAGGLLLTALIRSGISAQWAAAVFWSSILLLVLTGLLIRRKHLGGSRLLLVLAMFVGVSFVYLFPERFSPGCGSGMPVAFAGCPASCQITTCNNWVAPGDKLPNGNTCSPSHSWDIGCCVSYSTSCDPNCNNNGGGGGGNNPPVIDGVLTCSQVGSAGWCQGTLTLDLTATDPQSGTILVSGDLNGAAFACHNGVAQLGPVTCSVPLPEGTGTANFTATASSGLTDNGSKNWKLDSTAPSVNGSLSGTQGSNGWYVSAVSYTGSGSDNGSGLGGVTCTLDGAAAGCSASVGTDGPHTLVVQATDKAGNTSLATRNFSIDTVAPVLTAGISGTAGKNNWYTSATLNASATDASPSSGGPTLQYAIDGGAWTDFSGSYVIPDGQHTLDVRALDAAGNTTQTNAPITAWVDTHDPDIALSVSGTTGNNGWYTSSATVSATASDATSGIATFEYSLDNGNSWTPYTAPLTLNDGVQSVSFYAEDAAGRSKQVDQTVKVDTQAPQIGGGLSGTAGTNGWYISPVSVSGTASDATSGIAAFTYILDGGTETAYTAPLTLADGQHTLVFNAVDAAGWAASATQTIKVDTIAPALTVSSVLPEWIQDTVTLKGTAADSGSGLQKVEVSTDNGATWHLATGSATWSYAWNTQTGSDGAHTVRVRVTDLAGLSTQKPFIAQVDNSAPHIDLPGSWNIWDTVTLDAHDSGSGLSRVKVVISDPQGRWPARELDFSPGSLPVALKWDRRFGDGTVAPSGDYDVKASATDKIGNQAHKSATISIPWIALLPPDTATPMPTALPTETATQVRLPETETLTPTPTGGSGLVLWGTPGSAEGATPTATRVPVIRATPTQADIFTTIASFFSPPSDATPTVSDFTADPGPSLTAAAKTDPGQLAGDIVFGGAATAAIAGFAAYIEKKKQEEAAAEAASAARRRRTARERHMSAGDKAAADLRDAIAAVTEKENKEWKAARYAEISQSDAFKNSGDKTRFMHNGLEQVKEDEAYYRDQQKQKAAEAAKEAAAAQAALAAELAAPPPPPMPAGLTPEQQIAWLHSPAAGQWAANDNAAKQAAAAAAALAAQQAAQPQVTSTPTQAGEQVGSQPNWGQQLADATFPNAGYLATAGVAASTAYNYRGLTINPLDSGMVSVSAGNIAPGARAAYFEDLDLPLKPGGNYLPETVNEGLMDGFTRGATNGLSWGAAGVGSLISNMYLFGHDHTSSLDDFAQATVGKQEFWVSTAVDTVISVAVGVGVAALVVATLPVTAPAAGVAIVAGLGAIAVTGLIYATPAPAVIKSGINTAIDAVSSLPRSTPVQQAIAAPVAPTTSTLPVTSTPMPTTHAAQTPVSSQTVQANPAQTPTSAPPSSTPEP